MTKQIINTTEEPSIIYSFIFITIQFKNLSPSLLKIFTVFNRINIHLINLLHVDNIYLYCTDKALLLTRPTGKNNKCAFLAGRFSLIFALFDSDLQVETIKVYFQQVGLQYFQPHFGRDLRVKIQVCKSNG